MKYLEHFVKRNKRCIEFLQNKVLPNLLMELRQTITNKIENYFDWKRNTKHDRTRYEDNQNLLV